MGFKENLKSEMTYKDMRVKELSAKTGISSHTLNNYLNVREHIPTIDGAVKIAQALGVTVEYLATGKETASTDNTEARTLQKHYNLLNEEDRKIVMDLIKSLRKHRRSEYKTK